MQLNDIIPAYVIEAMERAQTPEPIQLYAVPIEPLLLEAPAAKYEDQS